MPNYQSGSFGQNGVDEILCRFEWAIKKASSFPAKTKVIEELAIALKGHGLTQRERANLISKERQKIEETHGT